VDCGSDAGRIGQFVLLGQRESHAAIDFRCGLDFKFGKPEILWEAPLEEESS
jgi:hypothetical protein